MRVTAVVAGTCLAIVGLGGCQTPGGPGPSGAPSSTDEEIWAIRCITLHGSDRFRQAHAYAEALKKVPGLRPELVQVLSDEDGTAVFYGRYQREYSPDGSSERFKPDHLRDLEAIRGLRMQGAEVWPFVLASMDVLPTYRSAHPEWDLTGVDGYWALHVAVFYNTEQFRNRRSAAEQYCAVLRERGESAYYHHGAAKSSVYIGPYPKSAVLEVRREDPLTGRATTTYQIVDPQMLEAQKRFPESLHNGHRMFEIIRDADGSIRQRLPIPSFPVVIPKAQRLFEQRSEH